MLAIPCHSPATRTRSQPPNRCLAFAPSALVRLLQGRLTTQPLPDRGRALHLGKRHPVSGCGLLLAADRGRVRHRPDRGRVCALCSAPVPAPPHHKRDREQVRGSVQAPAHLSLLFRSAPARGCELSPPRVRDRPRHRLVAALARSPPPAQARALQRLKQRRALASAQSQDRVAAPHNLKMPAGQGSGRLQALVRPLQLHRSAQAQGYASLSVVALASHRRKSVAARLSLVRRVQARVRHRLKQDRARGIAPLLVSVPVDQRDRRQPASGCVLSTVAGQDQHRLKPHRV